MVARASSSSISLVAAVLAGLLVSSTYAVTQEKKWTGSPSYGALLITCTVSSQTCSHSLCEKLYYVVTGSGSSALRDYISDGVNNATQDADLGGLYLPFYTEGVGVGHARFVESSVDYTIGDYPISTANYALLGRPIVQFPLALGAVVVYHNITGYSSPNTLRLNSTVVAKIFTGQIKQWDDPSILELNPNLTKASPPVTGKNITVCVRTDSHAAAQAFSKYLNVTVPDLWKLGVNSTIPWIQGLSNFKTTTGGSGLTALLAATPYGIAFTDAYAGKKAKLTDAALQNKNKDWVKYSNAWWNFTSLGNDTISWPASPADNWANFSLINLGGNKTYPIPTAAMAASNTDLRDKDDRGAAQKQMFGYLLGPSVAKQAPVYQEFVLPPAFLNYSIYATSLMKVRSSLRFFEPYQLPKLDGPYNTAFKLT